MLAAALSALGISKRLAGIAEAGLAVAIIGLAWFMWHQRGVELQAARSRVAVLQSAQMQDEATIASLRKAQARSDVAQADAARAAAQATQAAGVIEAAKGSDGPVAPVLADALARIRQAQGLKP